MRLEEFLIEKETVILGNWLDQLLNDAYPAETVRIFKGQKDRFANPLGSILRQGITDLYKAMLVDRDEAELAAILERLLLVRAVEKMSASVAVSFIFGIKQAVLTAIGKVEIEDLHESWLAFSTKVDAVALLGFDIYSACRERLFNTRINELKRGTHILTDGAVCPSALMRKNNEESNGLKTMNNLCSQEAR